MRVNEWLFRDGALARDGWDCVVDASTPGWQHTGLRVGRLEGERMLRLEAGSVERLVVPLAGSFVVTWNDADVAGETVLEGRRGVLDGPTDVLFLGAGSAMTVRGAGRVAVAEALTSDRRPVQYVPAADVPVELRGAGRASRQVQNVGTPGVVDAARLIVCEVLTPAGNWSSFPAHKHDEDLPGVESQLEEIYWFSTDPQGYGVFTSHSSEAGEIETAARVHDGDVALVPYGYHGPAAAPPGTDLYYLNVMAGPGERVWLVSDDPAEAAIRESWSQQAVDPRLPFGTPERPGGVAGTSSTAAGEKERR
ncbi:5-deoxy-glucuronate isomerase [Agromyces silvae]|uniref:5-deoxy-glucuronate isomerase n=1 Tax=Agromyces silvae TaxID=3388266 RepID=UPI00280BE47F|nr:5-deoxy-glucuronate isomerase [Agromyces protaetiae]